MKSRRILGAIAALAIDAALVAAMAPLRSHLSVATAALVLVVPVVVGAAWGGFGSGCAATLAGFFSYDFFFIPPYYTLSVGRAQNWVALGVYVVVTVVVSRVVARLKAATKEAASRAAEASRLLDLSESLVRGASVSASLQSIVEAAKEAFKLDGAALLLPSEEGLSPVAWAGEPLSEEELASLERGEPVPLASPSRKEMSGELAAIPLSGTGGPQGLLVLRRSAQAASNLHPESADLLWAFANHLAVALDRAKLQEEALRVRLLDERERLRQSLMSAVSHDLRSPLATIKCSASTLVEEGESLGPAGRMELARLIDQQADRLDRLVSDLLDMTRIQAGALELRLADADISELVEEALASLGRDSEIYRVERRLSAGLPRVRVDHLLVRQALANLIDNALRYSPSGSPVVISARSRSDKRVELAVQDFGLGVSLEDRARIFDGITRREAGGRGGLGLAIARAFVEVHGERIWVEDPERGRGARFCFTLPVSGGS